MKELADLLTLRIDGPIVLILRPREPMSIERIRSTMDRIQDIGLPPNARMVVVPHDFDVFAAGAVETVNAEAVAL